MDKWLQSHSLYEQHIYVEDTISVENAIPAVEVTPRLLLSVTMVCNRQGSIGQLAFAAHDESLTADNSGGQRAPCLGKPVWVSISCRLCRGPFEATSASPRRYRKEAYTTSSKGREDKIPMNNELHAACRSYQPVYTNIHIVCYSRNTRTFPHTRGCILKLMVFRSVHYSNFQRHRLLGSDNNQNCGSDSCLPEH